MILDHLVVDLDNLVDNLHNLVINLIKAIINPSMISIFQLILINFQLKVMKCLNCSQKRKHSSNKITKARTLEQGIHFGLIASMMQEISIRHIFLIQTKDQ